ncbi:thymidine kinase [Microvirga thermotolerans]|uniref:Thymidine kinase n=1 Tax=Microvirga thermotolerans TaxID=2651334 RepID=A0A5P9JU72_9HYPH|nr:thymidine kinase [Microvirga thermotolerans]QFU15186.1 thymidine kinase [Microvirga thermotolerans]
MAKLHFIYSVMNAGKTTHLLQVRHNYIENGGHVLLFTSLIDDRFGVGKVRSRIGLEADAIPVRKTDDIAAIVAAEHAEKPVTAVLIDEVQFMTADQVRQLAWIVDELNVPVMAYGLKNNVYGTLFSDAIATIMALAQDFQEIKQLCHCGRKATMILKFDPNGEAVRFGPVIEIGGENRYVSVCRPHWTAGDIGPAARQLLGRIAAE